MSIQTGRLNLKCAISTQLEAAFEDIQSLYRQLHKSPELPFQEHKTSARLANALDSFGYEVTRGIGGTGVVALLRNGEGPTVMLRSDMDALPIKEETGLDFASSETTVAEDGREVPLMHACGHDLHSSCIVGTAAVMAGLKEQWAGTLMLICQPAEEVFGGAKAMLNDGLYTRFPRPDIILGQHNMPALAGTVGHRAGSTMAACTNLAITIHGNGGHGSMPAQTVDPVVIAAHVVTRLQTIVAREVPPEETVVVTVGKLHAGTQANIIPHSAELEINIRSFDNTLHSQVVESIERIIHAECNAGRSPKPPTFNVLNETIALENNTMAVEHVRRAHAEHFGDANLYDMPRLNGSEDFPFFGNAEAGGFGEEDIPYVYWFIGATPAERWAEVPGISVSQKMRHLEMPHSPYYFPGNDVTLRTGIEAMAVGALAYLTQQL
ncbi:MAG TPA: amidohydrolase [Halomonas sp.]|jgi:hippurate hydrolase|uniref:amidohydrolase n=1 Tax=unclassified Halomonas TaxID=2609666 RepID=UPI000783E75A|nr:MULTISPECIES: amidohydrolase [unclassified Halomonas]MCO7244189.1 amidohydrolase [Halomonas sp. Ps84H-12]HAV44513.1 amidohydrolase [Halomonas sp.]|tara:strand:+ start:3248 stop:4558 length:1311 start_codon:yes stop_codon:yes gene_type:complete